MLPENEDIEDLDLKEAPDTDSDDAVTSNIVLSKVLIASNPCFFFWQTDKTGGSEIMLPEDEDIEDLDLKEAPDTEYDSVSESLIIFP
ncbi:hypothetical protein TNIN_334711 [Trichonephila inaurata madagascariensis]|uniref:Uncharacterized protein n=1 Tax=Trichonephila inaurata madagascariensis TaxID=2747483 RepID=A0A8X6YEY1_9ARAC|nr:hypothetical protein TNIN_334711 [Trichonephila inaurata madagascariensis]